VEGGLWKRKCCWKRVPVRKRAWDSGFFDCQEVSTRRAEECRF
jgi:hypothetical protein